MPGPQRNRRTMGSTRLVPAANFNGANFQFMNIADNAALSMGTGVHPTICLWVYQSVTPAATTIALSKSSGGTAAAIEYRLEMQSTGFTRMRYSDGATLFQVGQAIAAGRWTFLVSQYDGTAVYQSLNNGSLDSVGTVSNIQDLTSAFNLGQGGDGAGSFTGSLSQVGIVKSILSAAEITELYNGGRGKKFAQISAGLAVKFVAYWDLDDGGGSGATWLDKASTNHLTAGTGTAAPTAVLLKR